MSISIDESGLINNEAGPKDNPRELEFYSHYVKRSYFDSATEVSWSLSGDVPLGITIDNGGTISGVIEPMWKQPSCNPKKENKYLEFDGRYNNENGRFEPQTYDFVFTTTVNWVDMYTSGSTSETHIITIVKDHDSDMLLFSKSFLDGWDVNGVFREPYHCILPEPINEEKCNIIGGVWDTKYQRCSIMKPETQTDCENVGGVWEDIGGTMKCNLSMIKTQEECNIIGGNWTKNKLHLDGVEYDNFNDWVEAFTLRNQEIYTGKVERLSGVLTGE